ncbi:hypothetical protein [Avibacterium paragallinarum]|uniref:Uncharacterized protein n=1 Tax=Avibacterium paragallinarum TaxID=728 RepID=A0A377ID49_AVIPA|nr:hypothetical protein [Avibacterium paragallinarum]MEE3607493.1 hypothetical protein [Avibacterium paragallinarum]MEE3622143.1 hypothetical protein [Avibacterium paragallinarum]MEE3669059.1 hypothetical protein [Avibacterium paragallinarum]MEE3680043.1 hypothetical protein [Avibacterium paragallinarum]MEE4386478.1 hypothetical protein [Avibacterium paragallinarum]
MKKIALLLLSTFLLGTVSTAYAGNCDYSWQRAKDGSQCGKRASNSRY